MSSELGGNKLAAQRARSATLSVEASPHPGLARVRDLDARRRLLIVDDEETFRRAMVRTLTPFGACVEVATVAAALDHLSDGTTWTALVIDIGLTDGSGLDVLSAARERHDCPALVVSGGREHSIVNRAHALKASFLFKPFSSAELAPFLDALKGEDRASQAARRARARWSLSERETQILHAALCGETSDEFVARCGITENTYKSHVRRLLDKADYPKLSLLGIDLLRG